jgi:hypothetical protein
VPGALPAETLQRLRDAGGDELRELVRDLAGELDAAAVQMVLRNAHAGEEAVRLIAEQRRLLSFYDLRRDLALHPATPQALAMALLSTLFWRDLVAVGLDVRLSPAVRRAADQRLIERLPSLAVGERTNIARRASSRVLHSLRNDPTPRVIAAMLDNPRLVESDLMPLAAGEATRPQVLEVILTHRRWANRYPVRAAAVRNPRTPLALALHLLPLLKKPDLRAVAADPGLPLPLRRRAELLTGQGTR